MSLRTRFNKSRIKKQLNLYKLKEWKNTLPNLYTTIETTSRCGRVYTKRVRVDKVKFAPSVQHLGLLAYLQSIPFVGGLFR